MASSPSHFVGGQVGFPPARLVPRWRRTSPERHSPTTVEPLPLAPPNWPRAGLARPVPGIPTTDWRPDVRRIPLLLPSIAALALATVPVSASPCGPRLAAFKRDLARAGEPQTLEPAMLAIVDAVDCDPEAAMAAKQMFAERLLDAADAAVRQGWREVADDLIAKAAAQHVSWRAAAARGDSLSRRRDHVGAAKAFQDALNLVAEERTTRPPSRDERRQLTLKAEEAYHLAAAGTDQRNGQDGVLVRSVTRSGTPGGVWTRIATRGLEPVRLPMPILFRYDSDAFTPVGEEAAQELRDILRSNPPARIKVIGHTDRMGGADYNQRLSERRARRVVQYLQEGGVSATFVASGEGMRSPRVLSEGHGYSQIQIDELNRRVEFQWD